MCGFGVSTVLPIEWICFRSKPLKKIAIISYTDGCQCAIQSIQCVHSTRSDWCVVNHLYSSIERANVVGLPFRKRPGAARKTILVSYMFILNMLNDVAVSIRELLGVGACLFTCACSMCWCMIPRNRVARPFTRSHLVQRFHLQLVYALHEQVTRAFERWQMTQGSLRNLR